MATFGGWLPGSAAVAGAASQERGGSGLIERIRLAPYARIAIQMGVAVGLAIIAGDALSGRRFYWAVIAAFITFMGANTAGEQIRKSFFRIAGTFVGVIVGAVLAHLVGDRVLLQLVVVLVSLFLGLYLFRVNYAFMTVGITVMVSQLYVELDEFSNALLVLRLEETAIGAGVAIATVLLVLPLHVGRVARVAARQQVEALGDLIDRCLARLADPASAAGSDLELRASARRVDIAHQAMTATIRPMRTPLFGAARVAGGRVHRDHRRRPALRAQPAARLVHPVPRARRPGRRGARRGRPSARRRRSPRSPRPWPRTGPPTAAGYVRSASLFARVADRLPDDAPLSRPQLALRDLRAARRRAGRGGAVGGRPGQPGRRAFASVTAPAQALAVRPASCPLAQDPRDGGGARQRLQRPPLDQPGDAEGEDRERLGVVDRQRAVLDRQREQDRHPGEERRSRA